MLAQHAELIAELIVDSGWIDWRDFLSNMEESEGKAAAVKKAREILSLMDDVNAILTVTSTHNILNTRAIRGYINDTV